MTDQVTIDVQLPITLNEFTSSSIYTKINLKFTFKEEQKLPTLPEDKEEEEVYGGAHCINCKVKWKCGEGVWTKSDHPAAWMCIKCWNLNEEQKKEQDKKWESESNDDEKEKQKEAHCIGCKVKWGVGLGGWDESSWYCNNCYEKRANCYNCGKLTKDKYEDDEFYRLNSQWWCSQCYTPRLKFTSDESDSDGDKQPDKKEESDSDDNKELECDEKLDSDDDIYYDGDVKIVSPEHKKDKSIDCTSSGEENKRPESPDSDIEPDGFIPEIVSEGQHIDFDHSLSATEGSGRYYVETCECGYKIRIESNSTYYLIQQVTEMMRKHIEEENKINDTELGVTRTIRRECSCGYLAVGVSDVVLFCMRNHLRNHPDHSLREGQCLCEPMVETCQVCSPPVDEEEKVKVLKAVNEMEEFHRVITNRKKRKNSNRELESLKIYDEERSGPLEVAYDNKENFGRNWGVDWSKGVRDQGYRCYNRRSSLRNRRELKNDNESDDTDEDKEEDEEMKDFIVPDDYVDSEDEAQIQEQYNQWADANLKGKGRKKRTKFVHNQAPIRRDQLFEPVVHPLIALFGNNIV